MILAKASIKINAPVPVVVCSYLDYENWPVLFADTIRDVRILSEEQNVLKLEVDHRYEGKVLNILRILSPNEIELEEFKPKYRALFLNRFEPYQAGTLYRLEARIYLKGIYRLAQPFIRWLVTKRIRDNVMIPMKRVP